MTFSWIKLRKLNLAPQPVDTLFLCRARSVWPEICSLSEYMGCKTRSLFWAFCYPSWQRHDVTNWLQRLVVDRVLCFRWHLTRSKPYVKTRSPEFLVYQLKSVCKKGTSWCSVKFIKIHSTIIGVCNYNEKRVKMYDKRPKTNYEYINISPLNFSLNSIIDWYIQYIKSRIGSRLERM